MNRLPDADPDAPACDAPALAAGTVRAMLHQGPLITTACPRLEGAGAMLVFEGVVRPHEDDLPIAGLDYEAYQPMAGQMLHTLAQEALSRFDLMAVGVDHSIGFVPVHACSFRLTIASKHRAAALAAMGWFIDQMKQDVPLWKHPRALAPLPDCTDRESRPS